MDPSEFPFDIEAYNRQYQIEEKYIINQSRERCNKVEEDYPRHNKRKYIKRELRDSNAHHELQADLVKHILAKFRMS
ncbi:hypothetical protein AtNW77_Chr3g0191151 [Arabidopsis thaliana]|uniref:Uncharacterized protein n=1 Tax=Arabidopsis thaliana TaxID=3702 RepID=A0A178VFB0_ARATH|nr:hypothetical protein AXX17_AT3G32620 [Arabidopsis thaliana]